jgi:hypothetical protein
VLHHQNVNVADDDLADEKYDGLNGLAKVKFPGAHGYLAAQLTSGVGARYGLGVTVSLVQRSPDHLSWWRDFRPHGAELDFPGQLRGRRRPDEPK